MLRGITIALDIFRYGLSFDFLYFMFSIPLSYCSVLKFWYEIVWLIVNWDKAF